MLIPHRCSIIRPFVLNHIHVFLSFFPHLTFWLFFSHNGRLGQGNIYFDHIWSSCANRGSKQIPRHRSVPEVDHIYSAIGNTCRGLIFSRKRECVPLRGKQPGKGVNWIQYGVWLVRHKQNINLHHLTKKLYHFDEKYDFCGQKRGYYMGETRGKQGETSYTTAENGLKCIRDTQPYNRS